MNVRQTAKASGEPKYLGLPCLRGHAGWRYTINADCVDCAQARQTTPQRRRYLAGYRQTADYRKYQKQYQNIYITTEVYKAQKRRYAQANPAKLTAKTRRYELSKISRTPAWLTIDDLWLMEQAYELAALRTELFGFSWQVDHVIPLRGRLVSGLHVPHNLQVIPAYTNRSKSNRYDPA